MFRSLLVLLACPALAFASCGTHRIQYYDLLIHQNRYPEALRLVLNDLDATSAEIHAYKIMPTMNDEQEESLTISPSTLQAGKAAACIQAAGALVRLRDRRRDRAQLMTYHQEWEASRHGWSGCDTTGKKIDQPAEAASVALACLEDPSLETHQAATEIRVLLAKAAAGEVYRLSDEDAAVLQQQLSIFYDGRNVFNDKSTDSYYLPDIKHADQKSFCRAVFYMRATMHMRDEETAGWRDFCRPLAVPTKK